MSSRNLLTALERSESGQEFLIYPNFISFILFCDKNFAVTDWNYYEALPKPVWYFSVGLKTQKKGLKASEMKNRHFGHFENSKADVLTLKIHLFDFIIFSNVNKILLIIDPVFIPYYCIFSWQDLHYSMEFVVSQTPTQVPKSGFPTYGQGQCVPFFIVSNAV